MTLNLTERHAIHSGVIFIMTTATAYYGVTGDNLSKAALVAAVPAIVAALLQQFYPEIGAAVKTAVEDFKPNVVPPAQHIPMTPPQPQIPTAPIVPPPREPGAL